MTAPKTAVTVLSAVAVIVGAAAAVGARGATPTKPAEPGSVLWYDLVTEDSDAVLNFYRELFGWEMVEHRPNNYVVLHQGRPIAGISQMMSS